MQPMTAKEMEYIVDSISNEDLLIKQFAVLAATAQHPELKQLCTQVQNTTDQHIHALMNALTQHQKMAPTQPQN
ncbi:hypothetical protein EBB07_20345 [Paenibacillaceae bacterium]|nr:hypothetical protein EBB07_20345 [Paenibacillaceae bacterium]